MIIGFSNLCCCGTAFDPLHFCGCNFCSFAKVISKNILGRSKMVPPKSWRASAVARQQEHATTTHLPPSSALLANLIFHPAPRVLPQFQSNQSLNRAKIQFFFMHHIFVRLQCSAVLSKEMKHKSGGRRSAGDVITFACNDFVFLLSLPNTLTRKIRSALMRTQIRNATAHKSEWKLIRCFAG